MFLKSKILISCLLLTFTLVINGQPNNNLNIYTRHSFYTGEKTGEALLHLPDQLINRNLSVELKVEETIVGTWEGKPGTKLLRLPLGGLDSIRSGVLQCSVNDNAGRKYTTSGEIIILEYKPNQVRIDRLTGGLEVHRRDFIPFGFYTYSPVHPTLPEEEVVKGFNMISPYQTILPETQEKRKEYMDRCAQLGMKVHYNLLSVAGGGGVGSQTDGLTNAQKIRLLKEEILMFRDHPALLAWYIADEPNGYRIEPDSLKRYYDIIKELDPWHPVSMVFMTPFISSMEYTGVLDIVMADPYPVPDMPVTMVGNVARQLSSEFTGKRAVWMAVQAFGGGEIWGREPTLQELRAMTYQSIIGGARGIQYFIRQGLNLFPKSIPAWAECGRMAMEIAELTPWLLSDETPIRVHSASGNIMATTALHDGKLIVAASNRTNAPVRADLTIMSSFTGRAKVLFENRTIAVSGGRFSDILSPYGSQVYLMTLQRKKEDISPWAGNLIRDPGLEEITSVGVPSSCYARNGGDRGATYFLDTREYVEGTHSVRLITPLDNKSVKLRFFPFKSNNGRSYYISVWAKCDPEQGLDNYEGNRKQFFEVSLGDFGFSRFELSPEWKEYVTIITIPYLSEKAERTNLVLQMPSAGVAWFDMLQVAESVDINRSINPELLLNEF